MSLTGTAVQLDNADLPVQLLEDRYTRAEQLLKEGEFDAAEKLFCKLANYRDSAERINDVRAAKKNAKAAAVEAQKKKAPWICPSCGKENAWFVTQCACGGSIE